MDVGPEKELSAARAELQRLLQSWRRRFGICAALQAGAVAMLAFALPYVFMKVPVFLCALFAGATGLFMTARRFHLHKKKGDDAVRLARHLNRLLPEMEESAELLLPQEGSLATLARMQRRRLLQAWPQRLDTALLPLQPLQSARRFFFTAATTSILIVALRPYLEQHQKTGDHSPPATAPIGVTATSQAEPLVQVENAAIEIIPPHYTGKPRRKTALFDLEAEENAQIVWHVAFQPEPRRAVLVFMNGDTLPMQRVASSMFTAALRARESALYHLQAATQSGKRRRFEYRRLEVIKDKAPEIVVMQPDIRTEIAAQQPKPVRLEAVVNDDYGVQSLELVATLAQGSGEGIKFREQRRALPGIQRISPQHWRLSALLDLLEFGMEPGEELYFHLEARDNREPEAQSSRSETHFIALADTATITLAAAPGLLINPVPEYFRSQRQIIIDTEKLCRDRQRLPENEFKRRSENLGWEQQALRLRHGQFLGEESETAAHTAAEAGEAETPHESEGAGPADVKTESAPIIDQFAHRHDSEENATLFAPSIKAQLQAALAEMREAELRLRTHRPQEALPFEYRALALLKAVQQSTRAYVQRVGFEPPPIKVAENRLRGNLEKAAGSQWQQSAPPQAAAAGHEALEILDDLQNGWIPNAAAAVEVLELAGQELARQALDQPGAGLQALQDLRTLIAALESKQAVCQNCLSTVRRALWQALPPVESLPAPRPGARSALAEKYFMRLGVRD